MKKINEFLQKTEDGKGSPSSFGAKVVKVIAIIIVIFFLIVFLQIFAFFGMFNWLETQVHTLTGLDMYLVKGISFILFALFFGTPLSSFVRSFLPIPQKDKKRKRFILLSILAILFFGVYFASRNVYFNSENGTPMKYYSIGPNGEYNFYSSDGYDPVTGDKLRQVDKKTVIKYLNVSATPKNIEPKSKENPIKDISAPKIIESKIIESKIINKSIKNFSTLLEGQYIFQLKAGEETPWFGFEQGRIVDYKISSPSFDYQIIISDGTKYKGDPNKTIPEKKHCYYKIKAKSPQFITLVVTNRN